MITVLGYAALWLLAVLIFGVVVYLAPDDEY